MRKNKIQAVQVQSTLTLVRKLLPARHAAALAAAVITSALAIVVAPAAHAQSAAAETAAPAKADGSPGRARSPQMTLQANASDQVKQDTVVITISANVEAADQSTAGKKLSAALDDLMKRAKDAAGVEVRTGGYSVWPNNNDKGKLVNWRGQGSIVLQSKDFAAASDLAGKLGDKSAITNIGFTLSPAARDAAERKLLKQAAQAFRERALAASSAFGFSGYRIEKIELGGSGGVVAPAPRMFSAMAKGGAAQASADVPLEPDNVTVSVDVNGTIVLQ
jgi:predicted secreted protein